MKPRRGKADALNGTLTHEKILTHFSEKITHEPTMHVGILSVYSKCM